MVDRSGESAPLPRVSVLMAVLDAADTVGVQLDALAAQTYRGPLEIVVADNGSTDGSRAVIENARSRLPELIVVDASTRRGYAHPKNVAARAASGDIIVSCDADDRVDPGWVEALVDALDECDLAYGVNDVETLNPPEVNRWHWSRSPGRLRAGMGSGNIACRIEVWEDLRGLDESLMLADEDLRVRAADAGYRIHVVQQAVVHIRRRSTLRAEARRCFDGGVGTAELIAHRPAPEAQEAAAMRARTVRHVAFLAVAWPAALVSRSVQGAWIRIAAFSLGRLWGRLRRHGGRILGGPLLRRRLGTVSGRR